MKTFFETCRNIIGTSRISVLGCINIDKGMVTVSDGTISYTTFDETLENITALVNGKKLHSAYKACEYNPNVRRTEKFLMIERGSFKSRLAVVEEEYPILKVSGNRIRLYPAQVFQLKALYPFISTDISRKWSCSVLFDGQYAYATDNVTAVRTPFATPRKFAMPRTAIEELLKSPGDPLRAIMDDNAIRIDLSTGVTLQSLLIAEEWPDITNVFNAAACDPDPIPNGMFNAVSQLSEMCSNMTLPKIVLDIDNLRTDEGESYAENTDFTFPCRAVFHSLPLLNVLKVATHCNFGQYPKPCYFKGNNLEGVIMGLR